LLTTGVLVGGRVGSGRVSRRRVGGRRVGRRRVCRRRGSHWLPPLKDLAAVNLPERVLEVVTVVRNIFFTRVVLLRVLLVAVGLLPYVGSAGPVATEGGVEDEHLVLEALRDVALRASVERGVAPGGWVRLAGLDVGGHLAAGKVPDLEGAVGQFLYVWLESSFSTRSDD
jgi:hypothetical protein